MPSRVTVLLDTSASPLLLAVEKDGRLFSSRRKGIKQEKLRFPVLQRLLRRAGASLQEVTHIFLVRGPGRFTGIRIALTFASMMQLLNKTQVRGATLFEILRAQALASRAYQTWHKQYPSGVLAVVLHAFREEYFLQIFDTDTSAPQWLSWEELRTRVAAQAQTAPLFVVGTDSDFTPLADVLAGISCMLAPFTMCRVRPQTLAALAQQDRWAQQALEPLYLKPARFELEAPK